MEDLNIAENVLDAVFLANVHNVVILQYSRDYPPKYGDGVRGS